MAGFPTETFENLDNWTEIGPGGRYSISSNQLLITPNADTQHTAIIYDTPVSSLKQHAKVQLIGWTGEGTYGPRLVFRRTGGAGEKFYQVGVENQTPTRVRWSYGTDDADLAPAADIQNDGYFGASFVEGDWLGAEVSGTGDATVVKVWRWTADPGDYDEAFTNWGSPDVTYETNPGANACDTGLYIGLYCYFSSYSGRTTTVDNFTGGPGGVTAALTGTAMASITEADVVSGDKTIIITLTGDEWISN